ncbi:post-GPI attachment to proteins factor 6 [Tachyglossus aculeatus]|uniref:post-GPI attachment to proteins factor 6 n=1 Tax=Tachyglossus aculeatus TaxID=9261 RepID=UPI0018F345F8|nr:post-GPI attachment to proteins factor 6 [Tachyglossus aculeatus]
MMLLMPLLTLPTPGDDSPYVSEYFSQSAQKLSFYEWYGHAKLFQFRVPPDTVLLRWLLQASRDPGPQCGDVEISVHFRHGAPPVINPLGTAFPPNTSVRPSFRLPMTLSATLQNHTLVNVSSPAAGDWFIAAHLPRASQKIQLKGFSSPCAYTFQPDMLVLRLVGVPILEPGTPLPLSVLAPRPSHAKVFVPEYTVELRLELRGCGGGPGCPVRLSLGPITLPRSFQRVVNCTGRPTPCLLVLDNPPWDRWLPLTVESLAGPNVSVALEVIASLSVCRPGPVASVLGFYTGLNQSHSPSPPPPAASSGPPWPGGAPGEPTGGPFCLRSQPVVREDLDVVSVRFRLLDGPSVAVEAGLPTLLLLSLRSGMDSGGTLVISLLLNQTSLSEANATVVACVSAGSPVLKLNTTHNCTTAFFQGHPLRLDAASPEATLAVPFPETDNWFLSLQLVCPENPSGCPTARARVVAGAYLTPCLDDCGPYGQCSLLRRHGFLYAGCSCKVGWQGWSCTDDTRAQSVATQQVAALLLTLSNLVLLPPIAVAIHRFHLVEAAVYTYTMFFSTFYHACDQPGVAVLCIMDYDTLQYCDFLGSVVSIWVTVLCMARLKRLVKYVLFVLGTLVIAMSMQLDRRGIWNMLGPCLFALTIMISAWVYRGAQRRSCYPSSWKRWAFYLVPGLALALVAVGVYAFLETSANYYYTHSIWHVLVASSVAFLLPPRDELQEPWAWPAKLTCRYQICRNDREELYAVT